MKRLLCIIFDAAARTEVDLHTGDSPLGIVDNVIEKVHRSVIIVAFAIIIPYSVVFFFDIVVVVLVFIKKGRGLADAEAYHRAEIGGRTVVYIQSVGGLVEVKGRLFVADGSHNGSRTAYGKFSSFVFFDLFPVQSFKSGGKT